MRVVDTTIAVDHLRGVGAAVDLMTELVRSGEDVVASELVRFELLAGVRENEIEALEAFFSALSWVPVTEEIARGAGALARSYRRTHGGIDDVDYVIAATALLLEADLITTNLRHFPMIEGLRAPY